MFIARITEWGREVASSSMAPPLRVTSGPTAISRIANTKRGGHLPATSGHDIIYSLQN